MAHGPYSRRLRGAYDSDTVKLLCREFDAAWKDIGNSDLVSSEGSVDPPWSDRPRTRAHRQT